jgi:hypothetical protein
VKLRESMKVESSLHPRVVNLTSIAPVLLLKFNGSVSKLPMPLKGDRYAPSFDANSSSGGEHEASAHS